MNQNLIIWIFFKKNIISGIQRFYICADVSVDIVRVFFNFRFSSRKSQSQQNLAKRSVILQYGFTQNTSFPANGFLFVSGEKKICTSPFLDTQELHSSSTLKANVCIFLYISLRKCFSKDAVRF